MLKELIAIAASVIFVLLSAIYLGIAAHYMMYSYDVSIRVEGEEVYRGPAACARVSSLGSNTYLELKEGHLCWRPKESYVSNDIKVITL